MVSDTVLTDISGVMQDGSTVAQLCEQQTWHQLNCHIVSLQTCLVTFAYMAAPWPSFASKQGSSPAVILCHCRRVW